VEGCRCVMPVYCKIMELAWRRKRDCASCSLGVSYLLQNVDLSNLFVFEVHFHSSPAEIAIMS
jgi:hypothetical protein